ncbi:MBL fold metallo-hydrolase [Bacillus benzoevorans]|uniref:L-ascorbate metabolism protein UlaG (Beta-lactamase superfamily) n=1 Tax=Bacillus benzoevorans TaxID=1456 RepID=A0A7X0HU51_9BACI|nr:MBL fold metallo-hydrolase [Bacillus benzoevorans]MBB6446888.1 L-ascorbate metabolism protein UlaG (beta-lactamase superfamily) [Bacillus benzoevorans]
MQIQLIRHATHLITYKGLKFLLDPMFSGQGTLAPITNAANQHLNNPLSSLPLSLEELTGIDAIIVTHLHCDHFDDAAISILPKDLPLFCQPVDERFIKDKGFEQTIAIDGGIVWQGVEIIRTEGRHGHGQLAEAMGAVSGFILRASDEPTLYIIGDSVWYSEIGQNFKQFAPDAAIVFAGEARFLEGLPITMGIADIENIRQTSPHTQLIISHMESWNHCLLKREEVRDYIRQNQLENTISVPENGEIIGIR